MPVAVTVSSHEAGDASPAWPVPFSADDAPLSLATDPTGGEAMVAAAPGPFADLPAPPAAPAAPIDGLPPPGQEIAGPGPGGPARRAEAAPVAPNRRLRTVAVNALSLVALLAITLGFRAAWRGDAGAGAGLLGLTGLTAGAAGGATEDGPYRLSRVRAGTYELAPGDQALFVRGELEARPGARPGPVRVHVELVRDGQVLAMAEGPAGAIPTPEEIHQARDDAARAALAAALQQRAPRLAPGARLPFLLVVGKAPDDLAGAMVRVRAAAAEGTGP